MANVPDSQTATLTPADDTPTGMDVSSNATPPSSTPPESVIKVDIEHAFVEDDPRIWSNTRKVSCLNQAVRPTKYCKEYELVHHLRGFGDRRFMCQHPESWVIVYLVEVSRA